MKKLRAILALWLIIFFAAPIGLFSTQFAQADEQQSVEVQKSKRHRKERRAARRERRKDRRENRKERREDRREDRQDRQSESAASEAPAETATEN